ncbi:UDP-2,3-diacylglucosamine diphosphatase [Actimicrobium sp. CCI2.3]|uniref:UDP-2,3-diacylglucosamine diphosphatase n=1 Tax=Actimicrobium sp. CCI2.3 TaxID=3048616 RepID=UPI002AB49E7A|nr:UDP-2,3-diacylglucosamine diphosphatase [Actimicrobium sp. CCI2.3]MDY7575375.1 UDP-2,3-diacylglucosamine diphosphatase [Actimicrobium sp. CCI2.3]MEB0021286.1 UDP-2,3-diacylglucosamine diphosphatase [Actimicrobium sp. CCI2.3]
MTSTDTVNEAQPEMVALFVSDIHLKESMPATIAAFIDFLQRHGSRSRQLYLLGDLFEYWAGDDDIDPPLHRHIISELRALSDGGTALFWMAGNRDFLVGSEFARATGITMLPDGTVIEVAGRQIVLVHGDAQCTDDIGYMAFRNEVRQTQWQQDFLAMPLARRKAIIAGMRTQSRDAQTTKAADIMDVNPDAIDALFNATGTTLMIHGHTHRPATHHDAAGRTRVVLPDWDCEVTPPRGGWIGLDAAGQLRRLDVTGKPVEL